MADKLVTGDGSPSPNDTYTQKGDVNGKPAWTNGTYELEWWGGSWYLYVSDWSKGWYLQTYSPDPNGTYNLNWGGVSGTPVVSDPPSVRPKIGGGLACGRGRIGSLLG